MAAALLLSEVTDNAVWDDLVDRSPQGTVFSCSSFLNSLNGRIRRLLVSEKDKPVAICVAPENEGGNELVACDFTPYQGIMFVDERQKLARQRIHDEYQITEFLIQELAQRYRHISMPLSWKFTDVRPFQWHNYHEPERGQFSLLPRYTAILALADVDDATLLADMRSCRRQELKKAANYQVRLYDDVDAFLTLYEKTFARQDIELTQEKLQLVRRIASAAVTYGYGRLCGCETPDGIASMTLFLFDRRRAYYLFAANDPALRYTGAATRLMVENILYARQRGAVELDFVGVNSPNRGDFKLSFNPDLHLYFHLQLRS